MSIVLGSAAPYQAVELASSSRGSLTGIIEGPNTFWSTPLLATKLALVIFSATSSSDGGTIR